MHYVVELVAMASVLPSYFISTCSIEIFIIMISYLQSAKSRKTSSQLTSSTNFGEFKGIACAVGNCICNLPSNEMVRWCK